VFVSSAFHLSKYVSFGARFARIIVSIYLAIRDPTPVIRHISANLANSMAVVIATSGAHSLNTTRLRHTHCTSIWKLRGVTTPFISSKVVDRSSPSLKDPLNVAAKYRDCLQRRAFGSLYSWLVDLMRIVT
jgi:hypothetical protein